ncbi:hypothetical protein [Streptomyces sp. AFD10]|uniref:hypothetical protein n=1 Tax=Streptomyces sp. AFD10 TaxID=3050948 RepID=UPI0034DE84FD
MQRIRRGKTMSHAGDELEESRLQKAVEMIAITPEAATEVVGGYRATFEAKFEREPESLEDKRRIAAKIIGRYSKLSAVTGAVTAAPSVIPGVGTAVAVLGGGITDIAAALKLQIDMCMCLVEVYETELSDEDKKHLAFTLALAGSVEQMASKGGKAAVMKIAEKLVYQYLRGPALVTIKQLFKRVSITFTQKAMAKAIPAGVGVAFSSSTNYVLTTVVGKVAVAVLAKDVK